VNRVLAIDPGSTESAWCVIDADTMRPQSFAKEPNAYVLDVCELGMPVAIEMVASYGMAVGREIFETCVWIGRFIERHEQYHTPLTPNLVYRRDVKLHHCHSTKAKDSNITQALVDRFASGEPNRGKGTKAAPGWFYGFKADVWQAYALAVLVADRDAGVVA
jgi:hypothetical protein